MSRCLYPLTAIKSTGAVKNKGAALELDVSKPVKSCTQVVNL